MEEAKNKCKVKFLATEKQTVKTRSRQRNDKTGG